MYLIPYVVTCVLQFSIKTDYEKLEATTKPLAEFDKLTEQRDDVISELEELKEEYAEVEAQLKSSQVIAVLHACKVCVI